MNNELLFLLSLGLKKLLKNIYNNYKDPISYKLLNLHKNFLSPISFLDRSKDIDKITYTTFKNVLPFIEEKDYEPDSEDIYKLKRAWLENREPPMKIGRFLNKYFDFNQLEIENFVNRFKVESKKDITGLKWERVHGKEINRWYLYDNYLHGGGSLNRSCLRKPEKNNFINFISDNPNSVRLLTLQNDNGKLLGRALMWKLSEPKDRFFLDRIYTRFDEDINLFIESAKNQGWLFKSRQTYGGDVPIIDGKTGDIKKIKMVVNNFKKINFKGYPYMDTFQFYDLKNEILTNDNSLFINDNVIKLDKTDGKYTKYNDNQEIDLGDMLG